MPTNFSLTLLPGMGADARMFRAQQAAFPQLVVPRWLQPEPLESLPHYAARMAEQLPPDENRFLGGASFGGIVALEMACLLKPPACILICSLRGPEGLRPGYRRWRCISGLTSIAPIAAKAALVLGKFVLPSIGLGILRQLSAADGRFLTWATRALLEWQPSSAISKLRIAQIHGARDRLLPASLARADRIVPGAGHLLSITHATEVNDFLLQHLTQ